MKVFGSARISAVIFQIAVILHRNFLTYAGMPAKFLYDLPTDAGGINVSAQMPHDAALKS